MTIKDLCSSLIQGMAVMSLLHCLANSQQHQMDHLLLSTNTTSQTILVSCREHLFMKSLLKELDSYEFIIIDDALIPCQNWHFNLTPLPFSQNDLHLVTHHNLIKSLIDLMLYWKRDSAILFIDGRAGMDAFQLKSYLMKHLVEAIVETVDTMNSTVMAIGTELPRVTNRFSTIILICNENMTDIIITAAEQAGLFHSKLAWIITGFTVLPRIHSTLISEESQVTFLTLGDTKKTTITDNGVFTNLHYVCKTSSCTEHNQTFSNIIKIELRQDELDSIKLARAKSIFLYDIFYSPSSGRVQSIKFAEWTVMGGLSMLEKPEEPNWPEKLAGRRIRAAGFQHIPYVSISQAVDGPHFDGYKVELAQMLFDHFRFNFTVKQVEPGWGVPLNGTFTGLLGIVHKKEVDMPINGFALLDYRLEVFRYLAPVTKLDLSLSYETPEAMVPPTTYALPFTPPTWLSIFGALLSLLILLAASMYLSPSWRSSGNAAMAVHTRWFQLVTGTFFEEALNDPPGTPARVAYGTLLITVLGVFIFYTSVFTSFLAYRELKMPIRNLEEAVESKDYRLMTVKSSLYEPMFRFSQDGIFQKTWKRMQKNEKFSLQATLQHAIPSMYGQKNVLIADGASIIGAMQNNCSISLFRTYLLREYLYFVTRIDFPYSKMLRYSLLRLTEGGILQRLGKKYMTDSRPPCPITSPDLSFGNLQVAGLYFLLFLGVMLSASTMIVEFWVFKNQQH